MSRYLLSLVLASSLAACSESPGVACSADQISVCSCQVSTSPNEVGCGPAAGESSACCATSGWPDDGVCLCAVFSCGADATQGTCTCRPSPPQASEVSVDECTGLHCCQTPSPFTSYWCVCSDTPCSGSELEVTTCSASGIATAAFCDSLSDLGIPYGVVSACR